MLLVYTLAFLVSVECVPYFQEGSSFEEDSQRRLANVRVLFSGGETRLEMCAEEVVPTEPLQANNYSVLCRHFSSLTKHIKPALRKEWTFFVNRCQYYSLCYEQLFPEEVLAFVYGHLRVFVNEHPSQRTAILNHFVDEWGGAVRDLEHTSASVQAKRLGQVLGMDKKKEDCGLFEAFRTRFVDDWRGLARTLINLTKKTLVNKELSLSSKLIEIGDKLRTFVNHELPLRRNVTETEIGVFGPVMSLMATADTLRHARKKNELNRALGGAADSVRLISILKVFRQRRRRNPYQRRAVDDLLKELRWQFKRNPTVLRRAAIVSEKFYAFLVANRWARKEFFDLTIRGYGTVHNLLTAVAFRSTCADCYDFEPPAPRKPKDCKLLSSLITPRNNRTDLTNALLNPKTQTLAQNILEILSWNEELAQTLRNIKVELESDDPYACGSDENKDCMSREEILNINIYANHNTEHIFLWGTVGDFVDCIPASTYSRSPLQQTLAQQKPPTMNQNSGGLLELVVEGCGCSDAFVRHL